jgi:prevent-host-death family protein
MTDDTVHDEMGVAELKRRFSELLGRVELKRERIAIKKRGRPVAALVPIDEVGVNGDRTDRPRRGLAAAAGLWEGFQDVDLFLASLQSRSDDQAEESGS